MRKSLHRLIARLAVLQTQVRIAHVSHFTTGHGGMHVAHGGGRDDDRWPLNGRAGVGRYRQLCEQHGSEAGFRNQLL